MPSHMDGINNLPRWDPSNPTTYAYDSRNYDPQDYAEFKEARQKFGEQQLKAERARSEDVMKEVNKAIRDTIQGDNKKKGPTRGQVESAAKAGKTLYADGLSSSVFAALSWRKGVATAEFFRGGDLIYTYEMSLSDFLDWAEAESAGAFFNAKIRD